MDWEKLSFLYLVMAGEEKAAITQTVLSYELRLLVTLSSEGQVFKNKTQNIFLKSELK